ncbi:MAG: methylated-DNA--[protein]-cysteine S-methyltransferase, partial [Oscillospiraceae bacterium]
LLLYDSPVGRLGLMGEGDRLIALTLPNQPVPLIAPRETPVLRETKKQLEAYFAGKLRDFNVPLRLEGTPFRLRVWDQLQQIPYGQVISYGELARRVGQPNAARAVGGANHHNPISIIVPCHRVIAADGTLGGYGGGPELKRALLKLEGVDL